MSISHAQNTTVFLQNVFLTGIYRLLVSNKGRPPLPCTNNSQGRLQTPQSLWGCACKSNTAFIQRYQSKILRAIVDAPWYVTNVMIHEHLGTPTVQEVIHARSTKHRIKPETHSNPVLHPISLDNVVQRLKRRWPADL